MSAAVVNTGQSVGKYQKFFGDQFIMTQGFNNFAHRSRLLFFHKEKVTSLNNVVNKIYIVKSE